MPEATFSTITIETKLRDRLKVIAAMKGTALQDLLGQILNQWIDTQQYEKHYLDARKAIKKQ